MKKELPPEVFPEIRQDYENHDENCESLVDMWLGRSGGVSCPSDLGDCDGCSVTFYNEGLVWPNFDECENPDVREIWLCGCCARKRGYKVSKSSYGVHLDNIGPVG